MLTQIFESGSAREPRVLYLPNEADAADGQIGPRRAFAQMEADGFIGPLHVFSYLADYLSDKSLSRNQAAIVDAARAAQPDIIYWQHPGDYAVAPELVQALRRCGSNPLIAFHEADAYLPRLHNPAKGSIALYENADVLLTVGLGGSRRAFERLATKMTSTYYLPHSFDIESFGAAPPPAHQFGADFDAVMVGSITGRFRGLLPFPGARQRVLIARQLQRLLGDRFGAFGHRWPKDIRSSTVPFRQQTSLMHRSLCSVIWEHFADNTFYFSDRLPIAMASGVPFITSYGAGYGNYFRDVRGLFLVHTVEEAVDTVLWLRSLPRQQVAEFGALARAWAFENLECGKVYRRAMEICFRELEQHRMRAQLGAH